MPSAPPTRLRSPLLSAREHLARGTLDAYLREHGALSTAEAADLALAVCHELPAAPAREGLARAIGGIRAPELVTGGGPADGLTDVWGVGVLLHTMLAGAAPFALETPSSTSVAAAEDAPALAGVPDALADLVERALARQPFARFPSVLDLAEALAAFASDPAAATERVARTRNLAPVPPGSEPTLIVDDVDYDALTREQSEGNTWKSAVTVVRPRPVTPAPPGTKLCVTPAAPPPRAAPTGRSMPPPSPRPTPAPPRTSSVSIPAAATSSSPARPATSTPPPAPTRASLPPPAPRVAGASLTPPAPRASLTPPVPRVTGASMPPPAARAKGASMPPPAPRATPAPPRTSSASIPAAATKGASMPPPTPRVTSAPPRASMPPGARVPNTSSMPPAPRRAPAPARPAPKLRAADLEPLSSLGADDLATDMSSAGRPVDASETPTPALLPTIAKVAAPERDGKRTWARSAAIGASLAAVACLATIVVISTRDQSVAHERAPAEPPAPVAANGPPPGTAALTSAESPAPSEPAVIRASDLPAAAPIVASPAQTSAVAARPHTVAQAPAAPPPSPVPPPTAKSDPAPTTRLEPPPSPPPIAEARPASKAPSSTAPRSAPAGNSDDLSRFLDDRR